MTVRANVEPAVEGVREASVEPKRTVPTDEHGAALIDTIEAEFDIPIHHYVNVDFAGFQGLVSAVGTVDVWFDTPARDWNVNARPAPRSQTGFLIETAGCHSLDPETALSYVRSRYNQTQNDAGEWVTDPTADLGWIRPQQDFLRRVIKRAIDLGARNPFVLRDLIDTGLENVAIDQRLTPQLLVDLGMAYREFDPSQLQTYSLPAVDGRVGRNRVLLPMADEAEPVLALFRGAPFDDPTTVDVTVRLSAGAESDESGAEASAVVAAIEAAGFEPQVRSSGDAAADGLVIRHGPDGIHAARLVAAALPGTARLEATTALVGRSITVIVGSRPAADADSPAGFGPQPELGPGATSVGAGVAADSQAACA